MRNVIIVLFGIFFLVGCMPPVQRSTFQEIIPTYQHRYEAYQHRYELSVIDVDGNPLQGVKIEYTLKDRDNALESSTYTTVSDGMLRTSIKATTDPQYSYIKSYRSKLVFRAIKDGYYPLSGEMSSYASADDSIKKSIELIRPIDYFNKQFASTLSDTKLKSRILSFIDLIILQGLITESIMETNSVNLVLFKGKNYLQFKFTNVNVYNSLKLDKYDIGKQLFDEVVRKILTPLNEHVAVSNLFYGYDLTIVGHTKSFADKYAADKPIEYRFMIPEKTVRQYKNKDISGQQVLDASVILMDDERIELKLQ